MTHYAWSINSTSLNYNDKNTHSVKFESQLVSFYQLNYNVLETEKKQNTWETPDIRTTRGFVSQIPHFQIMDLLWKSVTCIMLVV